VVPRGATGWIACASSSAPTSRSGAGDEAYRWPLTDTLPRVGASSPSAMRIVVDLPAPLGPRKPVTRPGSTVKSMPLTAVRSPYVLVSPSARIIAAAGCVE
jgi:hypothetical protein